ncbi:MAG: secretion protein F [Rhodococcus sp.]|nr:secretion protein F [Rhodococcus sp. (in: high G+C Gram-positive bacteria)]
MNITVLLMIAASLMIVPCETAADRLRDLASIPARHRIRVRFEVPALIALVGVCWWAGGVPAVIAAVVMAATLYKRRRARRFEQARDAEVGVVLSGLETLTAELEVGAHPATACAEAADECVGPVAGAFRAAAARARLGGSAAGGFEHHESRVDGELVRIANVWAIAETRGLALAELLGAVRVDLLGRQRFRQRTEAGLAGARATAAVLAGLPLLGVGLGQLMGASPLSVLFGGGLGGVMLVTGSILLCVGLLWTDRIVRAVTE